MTTRTRAAATAAVIGVVLAVSAVAIFISQRTDPAAIAAAAEPAAAGNGTTAAEPVVLPIGRTAPDVVAEQWLNTEPLRSEDLAGKVVLYDFWTFGCINCQNTLSHVKAWNARYAADGLVVLSIHTPEFDYEADPANVAEYVAEQDIRYPVALDPDKKNWRAFGNHYWPNFYLFDRDGRQRYQHAGEGRYAETEDAIRQLLGVDPQSPRATVE